MGSDRDHLGLADPEACICEWPLDCGGLGSLQCLGCGGDICICASCYGGGERECDGCEYCEVHGDLIEMEEG